MENSHSATVFLCFSNSVLASDPGHSFFFFDERPGYKANSVGMSINRKRVVLVIESFVTVVKVVLDTY